MAKRLYGSLTNRLEENKNYSGKELYKGMDITMYYWSDRHCYFITKVIDQKHIFVKRYKVVADKEKEGGMGHQNWLYFKSNKECNEYLKKFGKGTDGKIYEETEEEWIFRYGHWNLVQRKDAWSLKPLDKPRYHRIQQGISFGIKDYYYDWEF